MGKSLSFVTCLFMGLFTAAFWAAPLVLFRLFFFPDGQYHTAFIAVFCWCIALNGITLILNFIDKNLACCDCGEHRIPESILLFFTLLGAGPATVLAMIFFCHKSSKESYHSAFLCISFISILFIGGAFGLAYGLEWHFMNKNVISTTTPYINSTAFSTASGEYSTDYQPTTIEDMTTLAGNFSTLVSNVTTTAAHFDSLTSTSTASQNITIT